MVKDIVKLIVWKIKVSIQGSEYVIGEKDFYLRAFAGQTESIRDGVSDTADVKKGGWKQPPFFE